MSDENGDDDDNDDDGDDDECSQNDAQTLRESETI